MSDTTITCPECKTKIPLTDALTHEIKDELSREMKMNPKLAQMEEEQKPFKRLDRRTGSARISAIPSDEFQEQSAKLADKLLEKELKRIENQESHHRYRNHNLLIARTARAMAIKTRAEESNAPLPSSPPA